MFFAAPAPTPIPSYCPKGDLPGTTVLSPSQWSTCLKAGWDQPTTTAANAGAVVGHYAAPTLIGLALLVIILFIAKRTVRKAATSS
jgi:hypothetical protein